MAASLSVADGSLSHALRSSRRVSQAALSTTLDAYARRIVERAALEAEGVNY